jgi:hypothetical protein
VVLVHGDVPAIEWSGGGRAALPQSEIIVPPPGVELEL